MNKQEIEKSVDTKLNSFFDKIKALIGAKGAVNVTITTADGTVLDFGSQAATAEDIAVGMTATIEGGGAPDGDYLMPGGKTFVFASGELTEIKEAVADDDVEALKKKISDLEAELETAKAANDALQNSVETIQTEFVAIKAQIKSDIKSFAPGPVDKGGNGEENRFAGIKDRVKVS